MSLAKPLLLAPVIISSTYAGAGALLKLNTSTNVTIPAGTYYWSVDDDTESTSFNKVLKDALNAAMAGTWAVALDHPSFKLSISYAGASTPTTLDFQALSVLAPWMFGSTSNKATASLSFTAKAWAATYQPRWFWQPAQFVLDDRIKPIVTTAVPRSRFDGSAVVIPLGSFAERTIRIEGVAGARVWQWAADDAIYSAAAGVTQGDLATLEAFWQDCRSPTNGTPADLHYMAAGDDATGWDTGGYNVFQWVDPIQLNDFGAFVSDFSSEPFRSTVELRFVDTGTEGAL